MPLRIHLDTDIGGDTDDLCALALLLASDEVELVGVTTCGDAGGRRLSFVQHALSLAGRSVPAASGAFAFIDGYEHKLVMQDERYWPGLAEVQATPGSSALELLEANAASGATVVAIGPLTNLAVLETLRPGAFESAALVMMGGYTGPPGAGLPPWPASYDYNIQADRASARVVFDRLRPLIVPLGVTAKVCLRAADLPRLRAGGPLSQLLARQGELHGADQRMAEVARGNPGVPDDILNFQYDSLAVAAALGWECVGVSEMKLAAREQDGQVVLEFDDDAPLRRVVTDVDAAAFAERWLERVTRL